MLSLAHSVCMYFHHGPHVHNSLTILFPLNHNNVLPVFLVNTLNILSQTSNVFLSPFIGSPTITKRWLTPYHSSVILKQLLFTLSKVSERETIPHFNPCDDIWPGIILPIFDFMSGVIKPVDNLDLEEEYTTLGLITVDEQLSISLTWYAFRWYIITKCKFCFYCLQL